VKNNKDYTGIITQTKILNYVLSFQIRSEGFVFVLLLDYFVCRGDFSLSNSYCTLLFIYCLVFYYTTCCVIIWYRQ